MKASNVYILLNNQNVEFASKSIKVLHAVMEQMCMRAGKEAPLSYEQVTRIMNEKLSYVHNCAGAYQLAIIERELLYTRRKGRKAVQRQEQPIVVKEGDAIGVLH